MLNSCSGGGSGDNSSSSAATPLPIPVSTGVFLDSPVAGIRYSTATESGLTNSAGEFSYRAGETVTFQIGDITLGAAAAATIVTPLDLVGASSLDEARQLGVFTRLVNTILLLQSLDLDVNPTNGLDLSGLDEQISNSNLDLNLSNEAFIQGNYRKLINKIGGQYVQPRRAINHLLDSLNESTTVSLLTSQRLDSDGDGNTDRTTTFDYNEKGQLTTITTDLGGRSTITYSTDGQIASISDSPPNSLSVTTERFEYDELGRLISQSQSQTQAQTQEELVLRETTYQYDSVGNVVETRQQSFTFNPFPSTSISLYFTEFQLLFGLEFGVAFPSLRPDLSDSITRAGTDLIFDNAGLVPVSPTNDVLEFVTNYQYLEDGTISEIRRTGLINATTTFNSALNCYEVESGSPITVITPGISHSPAFVSTIVADINGIGICGNNQSVLRDSRGRVVEIQYSTQLKTSFNFDGELLVSLETVDIRETEPDTISRTEFSYNSFNDMILRAGFIDGVLQASLTREYERRVLGSLP